MSYTLTLSINGGTPFAIEAVSFSIQSTVSVSGSGSGVGKPSLSPFTISKLLDSNTIGLYQDCLQGKPVPTVVVSLFKTGSTSADVVYILSNAFIASIQDGGSVHGGIFPIEQIEFVFEVIKIMSGGVTLTYDVRQGRII